jgi:hypothetical protein
MNYFCCKNNFLYLCRIAWSSGNYHILMNIRKYRSCYRKGIGRKEGVVRSTESCRKVNCVVLNTVTVTITKPQELTQI